MGIQLDWDVESDLGREAVQEDGQVVIAEKRKRQRWRVLAILAAVVVLVIGSIAWYRAKIVRDEKLRILIATVEAEAEALRLGDKDKFMRFQGSADAWRQHQREMFDQMQAFGVSIDVTGRILNQQVSDHEAQITVEIVVSESRSQAVWMYQYTENGWKHVDTQQEPWVDQTVERYPFTYDYNTVHQPLIDELDALLREWWEITAAETGLTEPEEIRITIIEEGHYIRWGINRAGELLIPQNLLVAADLSEPDDELRIDLAQRFSSRWANTFFEVEDISRMDAGFEAEIAFWLQDQFGVALQREGMRPSIFTSLSAYFGSDVFQQFMDEWEGTGDGDDVLMNIILPDDQPFDPDQVYFERMLNIFAAFNSNESGFYNYGALRELFIDDGSDRGDAIFMASGLLTGAQPGTFRVETADWFQDVLWVRATFDYNTNWMEPASEPRIIQRATLIPFRRVNGQWKLTALGADDWGRTITEESEYVTFLYPEIDDALYRGLTPYIEDVYLQSAQELGLTEIKPIEVRVRTDFFYVETDPSIIAPVIYPVRLECCYGDFDMNTETVRKSVGYGIFYAIFDHVAGQVEAYSQPYNFESALTNWAYEQHDWVIDYGFSDEQVYPEVQVPTRFSQLEPSNGGYSDERGRYEYMLERLGVQTLVDLLMETYGDEAYLRLVHTVRSIRTIDEWLNLALQLDEQEIRELESQWRERYHEEVRQQYGEEAFADQ